MDIVQGCHIEFKDGLNPIRTKCHSTIFNQYEDLIVENEIKKLLDLKVIKKVEHHCNEFISPIFLVPKKNPGEYRMILNLKKLNESVPYRHFKMDNFESVLKLIKPGCFMASIDLRHAYYSVFIAEEDQVKLRFQKSGILYQFQCLPNGIAFAPRIFTKIMKPIYSSLRVQGYTNSGYIDDSILLGDTFNECEQNVSETQTLMTNVGFMIHENKSVLIPTHNLTFLGNDIDSVKMIITLPTSKVQTIVQECKLLYHKSTDTIKIVARILGLMVSTFSAVEYGRLFYRTIEMEKIDALKLSKGNFSLKMQITNEMKTELKWWIDNLHSQSRIIDHGNADLVMTTDASSIGWAGTCNAEQISGRWTENESKHHINYLELLAVSLSVRAFCREMKEVHVHVFSDNTCAIAYINNMGGCKSKPCNWLALQLWLWCMERKIWLSAFHVPGKENISDAGSRIFNENVEWQLDPIIFQKVCDSWGIPQIDMFASRTNKHISKYVSWRPDAEAEFIDAFSCNWSVFYMYIFCPFSLIGRALMRLRKDKGDCIMIVPLWPTQNWWNNFLELLIDIPVVIPVTQSTLLLPSTNKIHPLSGQMNLVASRLSGNLWKTETFRRKLPISLLHPGNRRHENSTQFTLKNGFISVIKGRLIRFRLL